ncbi:MAG TPA: hypothetical protein VE422_15320 [Terriglobia bacterium]|nr:hypothetical protein [Terriglobia bacterium]
MPTLNDTAVDTLTWYSAKGVKQHFELRRDDAVIARMTFDPSPAVEWEYRAPHAALVVASDANWRMRVVRRGFLGLKSNIHVEGTNTGVLEAGYFLCRGTLAVSQMPNHRWTGGIWEGSSDSFTHPEGFPVIRLDRGSYFDDVKARVAVLAGSTPPRDVALLAALGLYTRLLMNKTCE